MGMSHVAVCAHVVMNAKHDCGEGDNEIVAVRSLLPVFAW